MIRLVDYKTLVAGAKYAYRTSKKRIGEARAKADAERALADFAKLKALPVGAHYKMQELETGKIRLTITKLGDDLYSIAQ